MHTYTPEAVTPKLLDASTVYHERLIDTGREFITRLICADKETLLEYAERAVKNIDTMRSPSLSRLYEWRDRWAIEIKYYGLD